MIATMLEPKPRFSRSESSCFNGSTRVATSSEPTTVPRNSSSSSSTGKDNMMVLTRTLLIVKFCHSLMATSS